MYTWIDLMVSCKVFILFLICMVFKKRRISMCILLGFPEIARKQDFYLDARDKQKEAEKKTRRQKE